MPTSLLTRPPTRQAWTLSSLYELQFTHGVRLLPRLAATAHDVRHVIAEYCATTGDVAIPLLHLRTWAAWELHGLYEWCDLSRREQYARQRGIDEWIVRGLNDNAAGLKVVRLPRRVSNE